MEDKIGGIVVRSELKGDKVKIIVNDKSEHNLIVGTTGSGKTQSIIIPSILSIGCTEGSMVINDPKGELFSKTSEYLRRMGYKIVVMDYFKPEAGSCFNQLFLVENEYKRGLPHLYASKGIDSIIKAIDAIKSGEIDNFNFFTIQKFDRPTSKLAAGVIADCVKGRYTTEGAGSNAKTYILRMKKCDPFENIKLTALCEDYKKLISFLHEMYAVVYEEIQKSYQIEKDGDITDVLHNNEFLRIRQEKTVQAAVEVLNILGPDNTIKYYQTKIDENKLIVDNPDADPESFSYKIAHENIEKYKEIIDKCSKDYSIDIIKSFLEDMQVDHEIIWSDSENDATKYAGAIATIIMNKADNKDPFWTQTGTSLIKSLIMLVCRESHLDYSRHLGSVLKIMADMSQLDDRGKCQIDMIADRLVDSDGLKQAITDFHNAGDRTKQSITVSASANMSAFADAPVKDQASRHDIDPINLAKEKTAIFLVSPGKDDIGTAQYVVLSTLFIEEAYSCLNRYLSETKDQTLPRPVYFLLDEVANIPPIPELGSKISLARSKNIRFNLVIQSYEQLKSCYPKEYDTIKENSNIMYLLSNNIGTSKEISERIGKQTIEINSFSSSENDKGSSNSTSTSSIGRELFTPQELMQLQQGEGVYLLQRQQPYKTKLLNAYKWPIYKWMQGTFVNNIHIRRNRQPIVEFKPDVEDFTLAYEALWKNGIIDELVYKILKAA